MRKRFATDEHVIRLENGKVVRTRHVRPKSLEDTWNFQEIDKSKGQPWDPSVTLTHEKLARERFPRTEDPTPAEEENVYMPRSYMITKTDLTKAGGWTPGCRKCTARKDGDLSRTDLARSAECRARVAEILAVDVEIRTKVKRAVELKDGAFHVVEQSAYPALACESNSTLSCSGIGRVWGERRARALNRRRQARATTENPKIDFLNKKE